MRRFRPTRTYTGEGTAFHTPLVILACLCFVFIMSGIASARVSNDERILITPAFAEKIVRMETGFGTSKAAEQEAPETPGSTYAEQIIRLEDVKPASTPPTSSAGTYSSSDRVQEMTVKPVTESIYTRASGIYIKNDTGATINIDKLLTASIGWSIKGSGPHVLIIHTHGSEAYTPEEGEIYVASDTDRTQDKNHNVIRVGDEIDKILTARGFKVVHDRNIYDVPYSGSYSRTLEAIGGIMKQNPSIKVIIDVHRDAIVDNAGVKYKVAADIDGKKAAQVMLVMGTGIGGLPHPNWQENLKLALRLQKSMNDRYPTLARPILMSKNRYNQHVTQGSMIVEIGTSGNTLSEALFSGQLFADCLADVLDKLKG